MKLRPLQDWAVIRPSKAEETTAGGLFIPDTAKEKPQEGVVEAIGPGALEEEKRQKKKDEKKERHFVPTVVKPGDRVVYGRYAGQTYTIDGEERVLVRERDILGILPVPLQIPAATASAGETALIKSVADAPAGRPTAMKKPVVKKTKKTEKKAAKKTTKKPAKKAGKVASKPAQKIKTKKAAKRKAGKKK
jgi:chaperonin GroES